MSTQSINQKFESKVRKLRERTSGPIEGIDDLGISLEKIRRKTDTPLKESDRWEKPSGRPSPQEDYESLMAFAQKSSSKLEAIDRDISSLNEIEEEANREAYSSLLGITEGNNARRALESDGRVVDKLRHEALEAGKDENVAENIDESVSNNIESLEENVDGIKDALSSSLSSYAEDFEDYIEDMAGLARDEYGAMAQMTDYLQDLDNIDTSSELGEMTIDYLKDETADILASQTQKVSEIYNEMVKATESTKRLQENAEADVRDRYDADLAMLKDSVDYAEETLSNMAGDYSDFAERAEAMIEENTRNIDSFDLSAVESWGSEIGVRST